MHVTALSTIDKQGNLYVGGVRAEMRCRFGEVVVPTRVIIRLKRTEVT